MPFAPPRQLDLPRFQLRAWTVDDAPALGATLAASDAHLRAWTPWVIDGRVPGMSLHDRLARHVADFAEGAEWVYGLFSLDGREVLGGCGLYSRVGPRALEIGYWLSAAHTGRGLATDAASRLTRLAFESPDVDHLEIRCDPANVASARVPHRLGYHLDPRPTSHEGQAVLDVWRLTRAEHEARTQHR